ncbi:PAS-domain containing protein [uncultured Tateyamaria sp.]|uniref:PAS-domain containing protein n=1 Tax=uncultured Tateyamaria sp. TaxID=455651 RepID=UPI0026283888|nr:PAS-domain containing protein [uncultured Tateyamaria sp.]
MIEMFFVGGCAIVSVMAGLIFLSRATTQHQTATDGDAQGLHFLFSDFHLEHASPGAKSVMKTDASETDWHALRAGLSSRFPGLPQAEGLQDVNRLTLSATAHDDPGVLHLSRENDMTRIVIEQDALTDPGILHHLKSMEAELDTLRLAAFDAPYPIWLTDAQGKIVWRNTAHAALCSIAQIDADKQLFDIAPHDLQNKETLRVPVKIANTDATQWYNVTTTRADSAIVFHAVDIDAVIQAEVAQRNFVQTLAKTFAQLSIGLAIFDRNGQLALFNPALVDLTSLPADFLSARPDLLSFFDRLRDNRVMPEPKNYKSWRHEISQVIAAATHGSYQETWTLDTGHTFRVSGRPHPDGAVAFLIEDITAEISLTRNFRAELEMGQSLMDTFDDALVAFSSAGVLTFCNAAYRDMWKMDPDNSFADVTIVDAMKQWQSVSDPDPAWGDMRDYVMKLGERAAWDAQITHQTKGPLQVYLHPIASGATVIRFAVIAPQPVNPPLVSA